MLRQTKKLTVFRIQRNIREVVQGRKNAGVAEFCDPRHEEKTQAAFCRLEDGIELDQMIANNIKSLIIIEMRCERRIAFIYQKYERIGRER